MSNTIKLVFSKDFIKKINFPESFDILIEEIKKTYPLNDESKRYQLLEMETNKEITCEEDFKSLQKQKKNTKIQINLVNKKSQNIIIDRKENININEIINESNINIPGNNDEKEPDDIYTRNINNIVRKKLKELENKLVDELYQNSMMEIERSKIIEKARNKPAKKFENILHKNVFCNECGEEIKGIRYKCLQCKDFNLCEICENNYNHDIKHIMISIITPIINESQFLKKLDKNISYKNQNMNYTLYPTIFYLNNIDDIQSIQVNIKNTGTDPWRQVYLKCIENKSEIVAPDVSIIEYDVNSGQSVQININFINIKEQLEKDKNIYYSFFEMFNDRNESFGDVNKIKIIIQNKID